MFNRRHVLGGGVAASLLASLGAPRVGRSATGGRKLVVVLAKGGWDTTYALDPKLGSASIEGPEVDQTDDPLDQEYTRAFGDLEVVLNDLKRPSATTFFENWHQDLAIVNGIDVGSIAHDACRLRVLTGTGADTKPDVAAITGAQLDDGTAPLGSLDVSGLGYAGPFASSRGSVGASGQLVMLLDPAASLPAPTGSGLAYPTWTPSPAADDAVAAWLAARRATFAAARPEAAARLAQRDDALERVARLRASSGALLDGITLGRATRFADQVDIAVNALAAEICVAMLVDTRLDWDTHESNDDQHANWEETFSGLDALMWGLSDAGLLEETSVLVLSEMGRTPIRNDALGKDHWPVTSAMFLGAGVAGGRSVGGTDDQLSALPVDLETGAPWDGGKPVSYPNLAAGVLEWMGVDPEEFLPGVEVYRGFRA